MTQNSSYALQGLGHCFQSISALKCRDSGSCAHGMVNCNLNAQTKKTESSMTDQGQGRKSMHALLQYYIFLTVVEPKRGTAALSCALTENWYRSSTSLSKELMLMMEPFCSTTMLIPNNAFTKRKTAHH